VSGLFGVECGSPHAANGGSCFGFNPSRGERNAIGGGVMRRCMNSAAIAEAVGQAEAGSQLKRKRVSQLKKGRGRASRKSSRRRRFALITISHPSRSNDRRLHYGEKATRIPGDLARAQIQ
jgi:hypothetical protein